ncbi:MAG TPA: dihydropteroate synthase [Candidatus Nitrosotalea sp.]|nr:dihydropteroate synthase [Candidatus Nitrosotalea sp.]
MNRATVAEVSVGDGLDVAVVGALNVSPESFYSGSVVLGADRLLQAAEAMARAGAAWLDVGAMSTAPYLEARIPATQEADRLHWAVGLLTAKLDLPVSADTSRSLPARAALEAGARLINDVTGLHADPDLARLVAEADAGLVLMASPAGGLPVGTLGEPIAAVRAVLDRGLALARAAGIPADRTLVDPGIGFFRGESIAWPDWDCRVLADLPVLHTLGHPLHVGVSRKSFIGALAGVDDPGHRLPGTLAATAAAVLGGAHVIRAHDVAETVQAVRVAQALYRARQAASAGAL